jgi:hypothetical protein
MTVQSYELDRWVLDGLNPGAQNLDQLKNWQGKASGIADYVSSWGMERFWAMSRSPQLINGEMPDPNQAGNDESRRYFAWGVARVVLCSIVGPDLQIRANMNTQEFQARFQQLNFNQQMLITELLLEIADTIQFWTMRLKDSLEVHGNANQI